MFACHASNVKIYKTDDVFLVEPGYYKENDFGIRIEDIAVTVPAHTKVETKQSGLLIISHKRCPAFTVKLISFCKCAFLSLSMDTTT